MKIVVLSIIALLILASPSLGSDTVNVSWTAPGDDGNTGTATSYVLRFSTVEITAFNFDDTLIHQTAVTPIPQVAGTIQSVNIINLLDSTRYWFAIKTIDDAGLISLISNIADTITAPAIDTIPPGVIHIILGWVGPNPFQESVTIGYFLRKAADVKGDVFNIRGRKVARLEIGRQSAGHHEVTWRPEFLEQRNILYQVKV